METFFPGYFSFFQSPLDKGNDGASGACLPKRPGQRYVYVLLIFLAFLSTSSSVFCLNSYEFQLVNPTTTPTTLSQSSEMMISSNVRNESPGTVKFVEKPQETHPSTLLSPLNEPDNLSPLSLKFSPNGQFKTQMPVMESLTSTPTTYDHHHQHPLLPSVYDPITPSLSSLPLEIHSSDDQGSPNSNGNEILRPLKLNRTKPQEEFQYTTQQQNDPSTASIVSSLSLLSNPQDTSTIHPHLLEFNLTTLNPKSLLKIESSSLQPLNLTWESQRQGSSIKSDPSVSNDMSPSTYVNLDQPEDNRVKELTTKKPTKTMKEHTLLPPPHRHHPPNPTVSNSFRYPDWMLSAGIDDRNIGNVVPDKTENLGSSMIGMLANEKRMPSSKNLGHGGEENPWRDDDEAYFENPLQSSSAHNFNQNPPTVGGGGINEDNPERESSPVSTVNNNNTGNVERRRSTGTGPFYSSAFEETAGLADVISRGRIDSVMYVYFGDKFNDYHREEVAGRIIQAVGSVIAAIAHVLTVLGAAKCIRKEGGQVNILPVQLHIGFALLVSNLLLLLAVHATEPLDVCASVAVVLHYLHLVIGSWLLAHTVQTYRALRHHVNAPNLLTPEGDGPPGIVPYGQRTRIAASTLRYCAITWTSPFPFILLSYLTSPDGYETRRYCWMSIEKGMLVSFIVPVFLLIGLNTLLVILSLRHLLALRKLWEDPLSPESGDDDMLDEKAVSSRIRASAMLLPLLAITWFLGVVALENPTSLFFQVAGALGNIALSWLVMYFLGDEGWSDICCPFLKKRQTLSSHLSSSIEDSSTNGGTFPSVLPTTEAVSLSFDGEPLLHSSCNNEPGPSTSTSISHQSIPGPSSSTKVIRWSHKNRSNWSRPGGNEIYELRHDAISTIYK